MEINQSDTRYDYISPNFRQIYLDDSFPNMIAGDPTSSNWPHLRHGPHKWYCDKRAGPVGFLNRDEAHILYNTALQFAGKPALEIGCFMGWSAGHLAAGGIDLDIIDPLFGDPAVKESVLSSLSRTGFSGKIRWYAGTSPDVVDRLGRQGSRWELIFIDGNHDFPAPVQDAVVCERYAATDALILFHDMNAPAVAEGLYYLRDRGWNVRLYHTAQIMAAAWRGAALPVDHIPDPKANWPIPEHLRGLP
jgi:predicted O-methyltransferase YrrM